jgi:hypothetical protein
MAMPARILAIFTGRSFMVVSRLNKGCCDARTA